MTNHASNSNSGSTAGLVVCERTGAWAKAWRRELPADVPLAETRFADDAWSAVERWPDGVLALEFRAQHAPQLVSLLVRVQAESPRVLTVIHADPALASWEALWREAGAVAVVYRTWRLRSVGPLVMRHLARAPRQRSSLRERIWQRLPWDVGHADTTLSRAET